MTDPLLLHRTQRISLTKSQLRTELGAELLSLCQSATADGCVAVEEVEGLRAWLQDCEGVDLPAVSYLREVVARVLADGKITPAECRDVHLAVEDVLPVELRRVSAQSRREIEKSERDQKRAARVREREQKRETRRQAAPIDSANFTVAGVRYEGRPRIIARCCRVGEAVRLERDRDNRYSHAVIAVHVESGEQIGFVPEEHAQRLAPIMDRGAIAQAYLTKLLTGGRSPIPIVQARFFRSEADVRVGAGFASRAQIPRASEGMPVCAWLVAVAVLIGLVFIFSR